jgi:integrase
MLSLIVIFDRFYNGFGPMERHKRRAICTSARLTSLSRTVAGCELCGSKSARLERHAEDYSDPYDPDQFFLCRSCHRFWLHGRFSRAACWDAFKAQLYAKRKFEFVPWWDTLNVSPETRWLFDARPRAIGEQLKALPSVLVDCNALQSDILNEFVALGSDWWTVDQIASRIRCKSTSAVSVEIDAICARLGVAIGYDPPRRANGEQASFLVLLRPRGEPVDADDLSNLTCSWQLHSSAANAISKLLGQSCAQKSEHSQVISASKVASDLVSDNRGLSVTTKGNRKAPPTALTLPKGPPLPATALQERVQAYARASLAPNTRIAYQRAWHAFKSWCGELALEPLPAAPTTISLYLAAKAEVLKVSTLALSLSAIRHAHRMAGKHLDHLHPEVRSVFAGIRRTHGRPKRKASPLTVELLKSSLALVSSRGGARNARNAALLSLGFCAALRRSELVALRIRDIDFVPEGVKVNLSRRKTDQEGRGASIGIPSGLVPATCPVTILRTWLTMRGASSIDDWLFPAVRKSGKIGTAHITGRDVARVVKAVIKSAGLDPKNFSAHSLRAGFATSAAARGVEERLIMAQTGHKSLTVLRGYIRDGSLFSDNPVGRLGL